MRRIVLLTILAASSAWADCPPRTVIEREIIEDACTAPLVSASRIHHSVQTLAQLDEQVSLVFMPLEDYAGAYDNLTVTNTGPEVADRATITYDLTGRSYRTWAYFESLGSTRAALIIPGSGPNQSRSIFEHDPQNYHYDIAGITEAEGWDTYVYIKPNEDCLAIHNGAGKLHNNCLMPRLLNAGGCYSARYLVDAMAWVKHLKTLYPKVVTIGLSQGGTAALLTALQSEPDGAFVASGWSVLSNGCSGIDQIILPGMGDLLEPSAVRDGIQGHPTQYTFSWGRSEHGTYEYDARCGLTSAYVGDLPNVTCVSHAGGHDFPEKGVIHFLRQFTGAGALALEQNTPNPFTQSTTIRFSPVAQDGAVLSIFDSLGRLVREFPCEGEEVKWRGLDAAGRTVASGVYTYRLGDAARKMIFVR